MPRKRGVHGSLGFSIPVDPLPHHASSLSERKMQKKAQFTVFIILGIVLLATFGFAFYARTLVLKSHIQQEASSVLAQTLETTPITFYVTRCLDDATVDALSSLSLQAGREYAFQGGDTPFSPAGNGSAWLSVFVPEYNKTVFVPYGIYEQDDPACVSANAPDYPYNATYAAQWYWNYFLKGCPSSSGSFGNNSLPKLCSLSGANNPSLSNQTCLPRLYGNQGTIQQTLEKTIAQKLHACANLSLFNDRLGNNITVEDLPNVSVTLGNNGFFVKAEYPFTILIEGRLPLVKLVSFQVSSTVPLKELYSFIYALATQDSISAMFDPVKNYTTINEYAAVPHFDQIKVVRLDNPCFACTAGSFSDIIEVSYNATPLSGKPVIFLFSVQNRKPALDYLHETSPGSSYDVIARQGEKIVLQPTGFNPDDGWVLYNYSGWKETENSILDFSCCSQAGKDCTHNPGDCSQSILGAPHNWTNSVEFRSTQRLAGYLAQATDAGLHHVTIVASKEGGLSDFQRVSILVFDLPQARPQGRNPYTDIGPGNASLEDYYFLDASRSTASAVAGGSFSLFLWSDSIEPFSLSTPDVVKMIPDSLPLNALSIGAIETAVDPFIFNSAIHQDITLRVQTQTGFGIITSEPATLPVDVHDCLPHRSAQPSWPYNTTGIGDFAFQANHTCCSSAPGSWGSYTPGAVCYREAVYGGRQALDSYTATDALRYPSSTPILYDPPSLVSDPLRENDILLRSFTRACSADRGNVCTGASAETRSLGVSCGGESGTEGKRYCQGPPASVSNGALPPVCTSYAVGENFEKTYLHQTADPTCNSQYQRSILDPVNGYDRRSGDFTCQALCNNQGGCSGTDPNYCMCSKGNACDGVSAAVVVAGGFCKAAGTYCTNSCTVQSPDSSQESCACTTGDAAKWAGGHCCQVGDYYQISGSTGCVNGQVLFSVDDSSWNCKWKKGDEKYWFASASPAGKCCDGRADDDYGSSSSCCYNGDYIGNGNMLIGNQRTLCLNAHLQYCAAALPGDAPTSLFVLHSSGDVQGGFECSASGWGVS